MNESLFNSVNCGDIKVFKQAIGAMSDRERFEALCACDSSGKTLLHIAAKQGHFSMVQELLALEAKMDVTDQSGQMPLDLAKVESSADHRKIVILLETRSAWCKGFKDASMLPLNRTLDLIQGAYQAIERGRGRDLIITLGETGVGKSSLLNYLNGTRYKFTGRAGFDLHTEPAGPECVPEIARVGVNPVVSETLYPQVFNIAADNQQLLDFADLAGINGTRAPEVELAGTMSTHLLARLVRKIKAILFVVDMPSLNAAKGGCFRDTIKTLTRILNEKLTAEATQKSLYFVITKVPNDVRRGEIVSRYIEPMIADLERRMAARSIDDEDMALYLTLQLMMNAQERIFTPDICDEGESRNDVLNAVSHSKPLSAEGLDFLNMDKHQQNFNTMLTFLASQYN